ncbi:MAG: NAD(P)-dependent oxidoreductase [Candidatus Rokuibacteriota bacterium]|nr:MAG: NAD(P)-dependent oxidoreductase [Candidatus Rokubacteria bacterium]
MILVTGATGTNGRLVVQALRAAGARVRAMVQDASRAADLARAGAELAIADFDRLDTLDAALTGVERSLLLSPVDQRLVERETRFVERAKRAGLRHVVKFSAIGAHPAASFTFGRQHGTAERMVMDSGLAFTFVQPNFFMQNLLWSAEAIKARGELTSTLGSTPASHVDARDIAAVIAAALTDPLDRHAGRIHVVTGPAALSFDQVADTFSRVLERPVRYRNLEDEQLKAGLLAAGQGEWQATAVVELNVYARQGHASMVTDTVERLTGRPARDLEQWIRDCAAAFRT